MFKLALDCAFLYRGVMLDIKPSADYLSRNSFGQFSMLFDTSYKGSWASHAASQSQGYGANTLSGMTKASLDPHTHLRQPEKVKFICLQLKSVMESQADETIGVNQTIIRPSIQEFYASKCRKFDPLWVQVLINLRMKHAKMFTRRRNSASEGWKQVFEELKKTGAPEYVTISKIKKKWMNLMTRYRQIKNTTLNPETITWPYFDQMDRNFGKDSELELEGTKSENAFLNHTVSNDERQTFIKKLIELRYNHRHLFTGRKYTARDGWMIIQSLLQCEGRYSIDQLSKCWQNLVQRYKQLAKNDSTDITWPYYDSMKTWFNEERKNPDILKMEIDVTDVVVESEDGTENLKEVIQPNHLKLLTRNNVPVDCIKIQLLSDLKSAEKKHHQEVMEVLTNIREQLDTLISSDTCQIASSSVVPPST